MRPLRARLLEARKDLGIPWEVLERDYLLSWILAGISQVELRRRGQTSGRVRARGDRLRTLCRERASSGWSGGIHDPCPPAVAEGTAHAPHDRDDSGRSRSRARDYDYYDLSRLLGTYQNRMDLSDFAPFLREKCATREVTFTGPEDHRGTAPADRRPRPGRQVDSGKRRREAYGYGGPGQVQRVVRRYLMRSAAVGAPSTQVTSHGPSTVMNTTLPADGHASWTIFAGI